MKLKYIHVIILAGGILAMSSCKEDTPCDSLWAVDYVNPSLIVEVDSINTTMSLQIPNMNPGGDQGGVYQSYFLGDFNVVASFNNFVAPNAPGNGRAYAEMIMFNSEVPDTILDTAYVRAGIENGPGGGHIYTYIGSTNQWKTRLPSTTSGSFRIQKVGTAMVGQVIAGGDTVTINKSSTFSPVSFGFRLGSFGDSVCNGLTAIKITQFNVSGTTDATLYSDDFNCNSIYVP